MADDDKESGIPIYGPMLEAGLYDPTDAPSDSAWHPYNEAAAELACCLESCKQITELAPIFDNDSHPARSYTLLATPVLSLAEHTSKLYRLLSQHDRPNWLPDDRENLKTAARRLKKRLNGPLRILRNQLAAHQDVSVLRAECSIPKPKADVVLPALADALAVLILLHNYRDAFHYYRLPDPAVRDEVQIFVQYPLATLFKVDTQRARLVLLTVHTATDPRHESSAVVRAAIATYNSIASNAVPSHPGIDIIEHDHDRSEFLDGQFRSRIL